MTTITALPPAPSRNDPVNFPAKGDALFSALPNFVTEVNAVVTEVNADAAFSLAKRDEISGFVSSVQLSAQSATGAQAQVIAALNTATSLISTATSQAALARASVANGAKPYASYSAALADLGGLSTNQIIDVVVDETRSNQRSLYVSNGTSLSYIRAVEVWQSPVPNIQSDSMQNLITKLLVLAGQIPESRPRLSGNFVKQTYNLG